jgi:hypothetical protein
MNKLKSILVMTLILAFAVPCIGHSTEIKRKKNKWFYVEEAEKATDVNQQHQIKSVSFTY